MNTPPIVSPHEWEAARQELLAKEKELTRAGDAVAAERRRMPRMAVEKAYGFEGPDGRASMRDLFEGRRQLIVYRFFFEPGVAGWPEGGCPGCSMVADQVAHVAHLNARDTTLAFVSREGELGPVGRDGKTRADRRMARSISSMPESADGTPTGKQSAPGTDPSDESGRGWFPDAGRGVPSCV